MKLNPGSTFVDAVRYSQAGELVKAEEGCRRVLESDDSKSDAAHLLAILLARSRRFGEANQWFEKAIANRPENLDYLTNYANALRDQGRAIHAEETICRALAGDPLKPEALNLHGLILMESGRLEHAAECFRKALTCRPRYPHASNNLGNVLQKLGQADEAVEVYRVLLEGQPNYPEALNNLGQALKSIGRIAEAAEQFNKALEHKPAFPEARANLLEVSDVWTRPLVGRHVVLRRAVRSDAELMSVWLGSSDFTNRFNRFLARASDLKSLQKKLAAAEQLHPCQTRSIDWVICKADNAMPLGLVSLTDIHAEHRRAEFMIGLPDSANRTTGIGLESSLLALDFSFNKVQLNKLSSLVYQDNVRAQRNALALGFAAEGYLSAHIRDPATGMFLDLYVNGLTLEAFRSNQRLAHLSSRLLGTDITRFSAVPARPAYRTGPCSGL